jgi:hypothetical protein
MSACMQDIQLCFNSGPRCDYCTYQTGSNVGKADWFDREDNYCTLYQVGASIDGKNYPLLGG